jgi:hypothetical protein
MKKDKQQTKKHNYNINPTFVAYIWIITGGMIEQSKQHRARKTETWLSKARLHDLEPIPPLSQGFFDS